MQKFIPGSSGRWIHLAHSPGTTQKKKIFFFPKSFLHLPEKSIFHTRRKNLFYFPEKKSYTCPKKNNNKFSKRKQFLMIIEKKKKKQSKNFIYLSEKLISYAFVKNLKHFILDLHFRSVLRIWLCFVFMLAHISQSLFVKNFYLSIFCKIWFYTELVYVRLVNWLYSGHRKNETRAILKTKLSLF